MKLRSKIVLALLIVGSIAILARFLLRSPSNPNEHSGATTPNVALTEPTFQERVDHWNETVWSPELQGQTYARLIENLWDQLRQSDDPLGLLLTVPYNFLELGQFSEVESLPHEIVRRPMTSTTTRLDSTERQTRFAFLAKERFKLEQSEFRHERFSPDLDGAPQSEFSFSLHLLRPDPETRYLLRGSLLIRWKPLIENAEPSIESVRIPQAELHSRNGPPPFGHVIPANVTPERSAQVFEPNLHLQDLDHNGFADIIISRINRVYWNQGQGQFRQTPLCDFPLASLDNGVFEDFNGDGRIDFLAFNRESLFLFVGTEKGKFPKAPIKSDLPKDAFTNPFAITAADIDADHDLDVWLAQYRSPYQDGQMPTPVYDANDAYPSYLFINDGSGQFSDATPGSGLEAKRHRRTYSASFVDYDSDLDQDLIVVSDFSGLDIYENQGDGSFEDKTTRLAPERHGFGMAHTFGDFDQNGTLDILMIGMNAHTASRLDHLGLSISSAPDYTTMRAPMTVGNRLLFQRDQKFVATDTSLQIAKTGWSWGVASGDIDNDGDEDLYIVNGHISNASVRDYEKNFWLYDIYLGNSTEDPALSRYFDEKQDTARRSGTSFGGHEKNRFFLNLGDDGFIEVAYLMGLSLDVDCRNLVCEDLDGDGNLEWLTSTFETWPEPRQALHLFPNFTESSGNWIGARLQGAPGVSVVGSVAFLKTSQGIQTRYLVNGDSFRSQHANTVHFGLGKEQNPESLTVRWPNGSTTRLDAPTINRYHEIHPPVQASESN